MLRNYASEIHLLEQEFNFILWIYTFELPVSFYVDVETTTAECLVEMLEIYSVTRTWEIHIDTFDICTFINSVYKFTALNDHVRRITGPSEERSFVKNFSEMKIVKNK
jgi:hypothetical protein